MAASLRPVLFAYVSLVFLVTHRICLMQCNPMPGPGMFHGDMGDLRFSGSHVENDGSVRDRREPLNTRQIRFDPSYLDFSEQPVGMPRIQTVAITNPHTEQSLQLHSISGSTVHFHASFFQAKVVQPLGNTTFEIVFLARLVGNAENTLFIHTSKGVYPYQVFGVGIPNPYRLRPFLGARVPVNFSFTSLISMHNPYNIPLQVVEMYSSGGDLNLELPSGLEEAPQKHWEIPPYETKPLMRVSFISRSASNHTAFIRIKTSKPAPTNEFLILPVEVEVTSAPGLFSSVDLLDFGTLRTMDEPKTVGLYLLNSGLKQVHISSVAVEPGNSAVTVSFSPLLLKPGTKYAKIATVQYSAYHVKRIRQSYGRIIIRTNSKTTPKLEVPFQANVLQGTIAYSVSKTRFFIGEPPLEPEGRELPITNTFSFAMIIYDAVFPQEFQNLFSIVNFTKPALIPSQKTVTPFHVQFKANGLNTSFSTILRVYTNASIFTIPIHCYDGKMKYMVDGIDEGVVDYGTVGTGENRTKIIKVVNNNPIEVVISKVICHLDYVSVTLLDVQPYNNSKQLKSSGTSSTSSSTSASSTKGQMSDKDESGRITVKPGHVTSFLVEICIPKQEGQLEGKVEITTEFEVLHVPIYFRALDGQVTSSPSSVAFQAGFPGRIESQMLSLHSTFLQPLNLVSVQPHPPDKRFYFMPKSSGSTVAPNENTKIGTVHFDPSLGCGRQCYMGLGKGTSGTKWLSSLTLPPDVGDIDSQYADKLQRIYDSLKLSGKTRENTTLLISTDIVKKIQIQAQATLTWPSLSPDKPVKFPLTHVGNNSIKYFNLENPSDVPVVVQVVPLSVYPSGYLDVIADRFDVDSYGLEHDSRVFSLPRLGQQKKDAPSNEPTKLPPVEDKTLGVTPATGSMVTVLKPRSKLRIPIQFTPIDDRHCASMILLRNNLTVLDIVMVQGQGARGEFMLNGKRPGLHSTLLFELRSVHLSECHKDTPRSRSLSPISVKKVLTATNPGQLAIFVSSLSISGYECEGFGFKVLNCKSFILNPNSSRKIEIAFTPDFTMSRVTRKLEIKTTLGPVMEFVLVATIPPHLLPLCAAAVGRTSWEPVFQFATAVAMVSIFVFVIAAAYSEAKKILGICVADSPLIPLNAEEMGQVFDLNAIAGVKPKLNKEDRPIISKRPRRDIKDTSKPDDKSEDIETGAIAAASTPSIINNNVNKITGSTTTQSQDNGNIRNRSPKSDKSNDSTDRGTRAGSVDSMDGSKKPSTSRDAKSKNSQDNRMKNGDVSRRMDTYRNHQAELRRDYRVPEADIEELKQSIANVQELECENVFNWVENTKRDLRDSKTKSKKKSKTAKRDDKDQRTKAKDRTSPQQERYEDCACSDDSESDGSSEKTMPEVRINQSNDKRRRVSLPNETKQKDRGQADYKSKKGEYQNGRPKTLDLQGRKDRMAALQAEAREPGPTSPHAIAAAVMSHLEKTLPSTNKDNCLETENRRRAFAKSAGNNLRESPLVMSPTNLSGSSRSSSYSSIVSDGSSSGGDQGKNPVAHGLKQRLKSSRSMPLGDRGSPSMFDGGALEHQGTNRQSQRHLTQLSMANLRKMPWSTSAESALAPGSHSPVIQRPAKVKNLPSTSLFESQAAFNRGRGTRQGNVLDLSSFGVSDGTAANQNRGGASIWSRLPGNVNPDSLFSSPPNQDDNAFAGKPTRNNTNNWVNFLDASQLAPSAPVSDALNNKTVSEIWDSGNTPVDGDGWTLPTFHQEFAPRSPLEGESDPVDSLFSDVPQEWSTGAEQGGFVSDAPWSPSDMSAIWGEQFTIPTSEGLPVSSAYHQANGSPTIESPRVSYESLADMGPGMIWSQAQWSSGKD